MSGLSADDVSLLSNPDATLLPSSWTCLGAAAIDGDNNDELLTDKLIMRNIGTANSPGTGEISAISIVGDELQEYSVGPTAALDWRVEGYGDLDGDGATDDFLWRNRVTGNVHGWIVDHGYKEFGGFIRSANLAWAILNGDDYNDDHGYDGNGCDDDNDDLNRDDYADDHGGSNTDDSANGGGGGTSGGGNTTLSLTAFANCINAAMAANNRTVLRAEAEFEGGVTYLGVLQFIHPTSQFIFTRFRASNATVIGTTTYTPSAGLLDDYDSIMTLVGSTIKTPSTAPATPGAPAGFLPHEVELDVLSGVLKWRIQRYDSNGNHYEQIVPAS